VRIWPCLTGALRGPLIYLALKLLDVSPWWALAGALSAAVDQGMLTESRFILTEAYLTTFAALTILLTALISRRLNSLPVLIVVVALAGGAAGCTVSTKFTGGSVAVILVVAIFMNYPLKKAILLSALAGLSGTAVFCGSFWAHFAMFTHRGPGCRYHPTGWCTRMLRREVHPLVLMAESLPVMLRSNFRITATHAWGSRWFQWPFMVGRGVLLWRHEEQVIAEAGTPLVWWGTTAGLVLWVNEARKRRRLPPTSWVFVGWLLSYLPFVFIRRVLLNYHYFLPLLYAIVATAVAANGRAPRDVKRPVMIVVGVIAFWCLYYEVTYGTVFKVSVWKWMVLPWWR
jgi:dolichyl-phosphate-mannose--protein O-mannosyl transferase